ncbi:hypothetical protein ACFRCG_43020 [Embleya sp. NPDC056575]|uniref:hypothetical protein n=1 Tax=Embleya sp. NPDC056575 TaxID=3345869 RepID=UPI0036CAA318
MANAAKLFAKLSAPWRVSEERLPTLFRAMKRTCGACLAGGVLGGVVLGVASLGFGPGALGFAIVSAPFGLLAALVLPLLLVLVPGPVWGRKVYLYGFFVGMAACTGAALALQLTRTGIITHENRNLAVYLVLWPTFFAAIVTPWIIRSPSDGSEPADGTRLDAGTPRLR